MAQITNEIFVPDRIVVFATEKKSPEKNATQKFTMMTIITQ